MIPTTLLRVSTVSTALRRCLTWCPQATVMHPASPHPVQSPPPAFAVVGFPSEPCSHAHPSTQTVPTVGLHASNTQLPTRCRNRSRQSLHHLHGAGLPTSSGSRCCRAVLPPSAILSSSERHFQLHPFDDVRRLLNTSRCSR